jgi:CheY-like chemotaxis protein
MVYGFMKQSGGHIAIESEEKRGTTISLYLPRSIEEAAVSTLHSRSETQRGSETILVVEDDPLVRENVVAQLKKLGYHTITASNGPEALALLNQGLAFDLLFTDMIMPGGMNGRELAEAATRQRPGLPVLYMSGYPQAAMSDDGRLDPGITLLSKPYRPSDLARSIREVLGSRAAENGPS